MTKKPQYSLCISDLLMGMLFIFMLLLAKYMLEYSNKTQELLFPLTQRNKLLEEIKTDLQNQNISVTIDQKNGVLKLTDIYYFNKGSYTLSQPGKNNLEKIRSIFVKTLPCYSNKSKTQERQKNINEFEDTNQINRIYKNCNNKKNNLIDSILIEGYADSTPTGEGLKSKGIENNIELAMKRSQTIFILLTEYHEKDKNSKEYGNELYLLSNSQGQSLFGVASYGNLRSKKNQRTLASDKKDRHIDIRFIMAQPEKIKKELKESK